MKIQFILDLYNEHLHIAFEESVEKLIKDAKLVREKRTYSDKHEFHYLLKTSSELSILQTGINIAIIHAKDDELEQSKKLFREKVFK